MSYTIHTSYVPRMYAKGFWLSTALHWELMSVIIYNTCVLYGALGGVILGLVYSCLSATTVVRVEEAINGGNLELKDGYFYAPVRVRWTIRDNVNGGS